MANRIQRRPDRSSTNRTRSSSSANERDADHVIAVITDLNELLDLAISRIKSYHNMTVLLRTKQEHSKSTVVQLRSPNYLQAIGTMLQHAQDDILKTSAALPQPNVDKLCWTVSSYRALMEAYRRIPELLNQVYEHCSTIISTGRMSHVGEKFGRLYREMTRLQRPTDVPEGSIASWTNCVREIYIS